jgi:putative Holliday junction resolvase
VAALDGALALVEVHHVAPGVREHLDLDVAGPHDELLQVERAIAEELLRAVRALLDRAGDEGDVRVFRRLRELVKREDIGTIVVGDPVNMDGTAGPRAETSRDFAGRLQKALRQVRVELFDERLSSFSADEWMDRDGVKPAQRKTRRDAYAAAVILMDYLQEVEKRESTDGTG